MKNEGIIPAYAGSTRSCPARRPPASDHPRIRGEHGVLLLSGCLVPGSSPHTRGARVCRCPGRPGRGIIPAYAGSTGVEAYPIFDEADHPRIRGEHRRAIWNDAMMMGSSPHTRGALSCRAHRWRIGWIIPAYAGSTVEIPAASFPSEDHPRIRGEHGSGNGKAVHQDGSSPHTRGARRRTPLGRHPCGIIPAYAGSTPCGTPILTECRDHPRIRGEHDCSIYFTNFPTGSSPHTRGALSLSGALIGCGRIIPAYAGSTFRLIFSQARSRDHPRIRGEHTAALIGPAIAGGSSPHTRGARHQ